MRLTTKTSYGIRALIDLAIMHGAGKPLTIKNISQREGISSVYLEQIFNKLKNHGIVKSVRGPKGGYILARDPEKVSVYDAIEALEGGVSSVGCVSERSKKKCIRLGKCASKEVWDEVTRQIQKTLGSFSIGYLAKKAVEIDSRNN